MAAASSIDIDVYRLRLLRIIETLGENVLKFILKHGTNAPNPPVSLQNYLHALPNTSTANYCQMSNKNKKKIFTKAEQNQISVDFTWDRFDVSLLWKAIRCACENIAKPDAVQWGDMKSLEGLINKIKDQRNQIVHERHQLMPNEFEAKVKEMKSLFIKTLDAAQTRYNVSDKEITDEKRRIEEGIQHISGCFKIEEMCQDRIKFLQTFKSMLLSSLKTVFKSTQTFDPLSFLSGSPQTPLHIQHIFSNIYIFEHQRKIKIPHLKIMDSIQSLGGTALFLLKGGAGSGKSTLLLYILSEWLKDERDRCIANLSAYDLVLYVVCRDEKCASLEEFFKQVFPEFDVFGSKTMNLFKECKTLIMIDGLDELNSSSSQLIKDILSQGRMVPELHILFTSRPEVVVDFLRKVPTEYKKGEAMMEGISSEERIEFMEKYYKALCGNSFTGKAKHAMERIVWRDHFGLPLNLLFLTTLMCDNPDSIRENTTQTILYDTMHEWCIEKLQYRLAVHAQSKNTGYESRKEAIMRIMDIIGRVALEGILLNTLIISPKDRLRLEKCCRDENLPSSEVLGAFMSLRKYIVNRVIHETYCTPHKGLQEFYSAKYIVKHLQDQNLADLGEEPGISAGTKLKELLTWGFPLFRSSSGGSVWRLLQNSSQKKLKPGEVNNLRNLLLHVAGLLSRPNVSSLPGAIEVRSLFSSSISHSLIIN